MTGFALHKITYISASSVNSYATDAALWCVQRLLGMSVPVGCAAERGSAIEDGVTAGLLNPDLPVEDAQEIALKRYDMKTAFNPDNNREKERDAITPSVAIALEELRQYGIPDMVQKKISVNLPDVPVPLIGFLDFGWSNSKIILDLKTSLKLTSEISDGHARQVAGYIYGTDFQGRVCYVTPKRLAVYALSDPDERINEVIQIAKRMDRFLSLSADPMELAGLVTPNYEHFFWHSPIARAHGKQVFGW